MHLFESKPKKAKSNSKRNRSKQSVARNNTTGPNTHKELFKDSLERAKILMQKETVKNAGAFATIGAVLSLTARTAATACNPAMLNSAQLSVGLGIVAISIGVIGYMYFFG